MAIESCDDDDDVVDRIIFVVPHDEDGGNVVNATTE